MLLLLVVLVLVVVVAVVAVVVVVVAAVVVVVVVAAVVLRRRGRTVIRCGAWRPRGATARERHPKCMRLILVPETTVPAHGTAAAAWWRLWRLVRSRYPASGHTLSRGA